MKPQQLLTSIIIVASFLGLSACSGGQGSSGFVPAAPHTASVSRTAKDDIEPHL